MTLLTARAPGLTAALRATGARYVPLDGTLAECDRVGDSRADSLGKHRKHGVNLQVITAPDGTLVWISPALTGRVHDLTAARRHRIIATCIRLGIPALADKAYQGADDAITVPHRRRPGKEISPSNRSRSTPQSTNQSQPTHVIARAILTLQTRC
ncbi:transposase family protein [Streptomyces chartreusis]